MRRMTGRAAFRFHRYVFVNEGSVFVGVALIANRVSAGQRAHLAKDTSPMRIVAVRTLNESLVHPMPIGPREIRLGGNVAAVAEVWLRLQ